MQFIKVPNCCLYPKNRFVFEQFYFFADQDSCIWTIYHCHAFFQDLHAYARAYIQFPMLESLTLVKSCQTGSENERHALAIYEFAYAAMGQISPCIAEQLLTFKEPSAAVKLQIECSIFDSKVQLDCFENVGTLDPNDEEVDCSEQLEERISACRDEGLEDAPATCLEAGSLDEDAEIELSEFHNAFMEMVDTCAVRLF